MKEVEMPPVAPGHAEDGGRPAEEPQTRIAELDDAPRRGVADAEEGRVFPAAEVFDDVRARCKATLEGKGE
jgi:hypothetical protein